MVTDLEDAIAGRLGRPLRHLAAVDSTNSEALRWAAEGAPHGATVVADDQSAGRGRWGRRWISAPGSSLLMSVVLRPAPAVARSLGLMTIAAGLACAEAVDRTTGVTAGLKWPNDVLIGDRKVAGVLIETRISARAVEALVVGIGVDLDWPQGPPAAIAARTTSLAAGARSAGHPAPSRAEVFGAILAALEEVTELVGRDEGAAEVVRRAQSRMGDIGHEVVLEGPDGGSRVVIAERLLASGALLVSSDRGTEEVSAAGISSLRAPEG